jgi:cell division protein FtsW
MMQTLANARRTGSRSGVRSSTGQTEAKPRAKGGSFWLVVVLVAVLCLTGVVMVLSASSITSLQKYGTPWHFFIRQLVWLFFGSLGFGLALRVDHRRWRRLARPAMYGCVGLLFAVLIPGVGVRTAGASRWLGTSSLQLQPSELAKLALVFFAADLLDRRSGEGSWRYQMLPVISMFVVLAVLVMAQPDMGTTLVLACIALCMLYTAGLPAGPFAGLLAGGAGSFLLLAIAAPYRWKRMTAFVNPFKDPTDTGYQSVQALLALSHGHVLGDGIGSSIASYGYLPNAQTDFIFAVIGEETGLLGGLLLSSLFLVFALVGTRVTCRAPSRYAAFLAAGITAWLVGQAIINIGAVVGLLPVTGVPLPFVSFGGSSLVIAMFGAGVLANIAKQA